MRFGAAGDGGGVMTQAAETLYHYYQQQAVLPTYAGLASSDDLRQHEALRRRLFLECLHLPPALFQGARLVEFGPDSGENALVFARWGARLTLVEPNPNSWARIREYFQRFALRDQLEALEPVALEQFETDRRFQVIDAEGFIYTVKPESIWINRFHQLLVEGGFVILFYYELFGSLLELMLKVIYMRAKTLMRDSEGVDVARRLFQAKWDSLPHTRAFESWVMDVLENPYVRLKYFFEASALCAQLSASGFSLYSAWPTYRNRLWVYWYKREVDPQRVLAQDARFVARSCLSFAFGRQLFLCAESDEAVAVVNRDLRNLLGAVDALIDTFAAETVDRCDRQLARIREIMLNEPILPDGAYDKQDVVRIVDSLRTILRLLATGDTGSLITRCQTDGAFIQAWGMPGHFAVFQKVRQG